MGMPSKQELERVRKKLSKVEPTFILPRNASVADRLKYDICKEFVIYLQENHMDQIELAKELRVDPARISEIVKYKIDLFTLDRLLKLLEKIRPDLDIRVA